MTAIWRSSLLLRRRLRGTVEILQRLLTLVQIFFQLAYGYFDEREPLIGVDWRGIPRDENRPWH